MPSTPCKDLADLERQLRALSERVSPCFIAIGGFGGSGKSSLAEKLSEALAASIVSSDDFYDPAQGHPDLDRLRVEAVEPLHSFGYALFRRFGWALQGLGGWVEIHSTGVVIVEGVMVLSPKLLPSYDVTIWLECPQHVAFERGVARDLAQYGVDTRVQWLEVWMPQELAYAQEHRPWEWADIVINTDELMGADP